MENIAGSWELVAGGWWLLAGKRENKKEINEHTDTTRTPVCIYI